MSDGNSFTAGIDVRSVTPGYEGIVRHGDGTATKVWAPTEVEAREKAQGVASDS